MKQLDRHIRNTVFAAMVVVIVLIAVLDLIFSLLDQAADTGANYSMGDATAFVLFTLPTSLYELLPFAALGGALTGLGVLASNNELVVMQAAGVRVSRIVLAVLKPTLLVMAAGLLLGEYVAPPLQQQAQSNKAIQRSGNTINPEQGAWQRVGDEFIHINAITPGGRELFGVSRYRVDERHRLVAAGFAESATYMEQADGSHWRLFNGTESRFVSDGNPDERLEDEGLEDEELQERPESILTENYEYADWRVDLSPELLSVLLVEPEEQSISGLYRFARFFEAEGLASDTYYLAFWKKLLQPLATLALVLLAVSFIFGPLREATMGARVFSALGIGLAFTIVQEVMEPASLLYGFSPLLAVLAPVLLCAGLGLLLLRQVR